MQAINRVASKGPIFIKLDTQGTELSIIQGAQTLFDQQRILGVEMESTMLSQPIMKGSGKFWQACEYMEQQGFELLHIKPIYAPKRTGLFKPNLHTFLNECDAVFALRIDLAEALPVESRTSLLAFYITNFLYEEAMSVLKRDTEVADFLRRQGCNVNALLSTLKAVA